MYNPIARPLLHMIASSMIILCAAFAAAAQIETDLDPNSPAPVLVRDQATQRVLAFPRKMLERGELSDAASDRPYPKGSRVVLFLTNVALLPGEGAGAFRVTVRDGSGRKFRFPVEEIKLISPGAAETDNVYALVIKLTDELKYWPDMGSGDVLVSVTWRGMASGTALLGIDGMGGTKPAAPQVSEFDARNADGPGGRFDPRLMGYRWSGDRMRLMEQATFGPTAALDARIRKIGIRNWIAEQFDAQYPSLTNPYPNHPLKPANAPSNCDNDQTVVPDVPATCFRDTYTMYQPQTWFMREALYGDAQLRHRVAWALAQVWVTSGLDIQQGRQMIEYYKVLANNAFGNYRSLMKQMTLNPTMGTYLDMAISTKNNPNENYAREIMQLFTVGLFMLNADGTLKRDASGDPTPTYDQNGVNDLTKVLTGWTLCQTPGAGCPNLVTGTFNYVDPLLLNRNNHDLTAKTLLSYPGSTTSSVAACTGCTGTAINTYADNSMEQALDNIFNHPNVGPFVSKILIQHLVTSDPTPAYVGRVAGIFNNNGLGVRGDMRAVVRAILLDPEARGDIKTDPSYGKLREPVLYTTNVLRTFNVRSANGTSTSDGYFTARGEFVGMAQVPFASPTVFNFYPPDYVIPGTANLGPEFAIMTTSTSIQRANWINRLVFTAPAIAQDLNATPNAPAGTSLDFSDLQALSAADATGNLLLDELSRRMLHSTMTPAFRNTLLPAITSYTATDTLNRVRQAVYLTATSSQYQVQR